MMLACPPFSLVTANDDFVLIDKAPSIDMHQRGEQPGIVTQVREALGFDELYPVHRLDSMTSGLLLLARHRAANQALSGLFRERRVEKYYVALSDRKPSRKQGRVVGDLLKSRDGSWKLAKTMENPSVTRFLSQGTGLGLRLFLLRPFTGKTHQLRVVMRSLGAPILGDPRYYSGTSPYLAGEGTLSGADRGYLHAFGLVFPWQGEVLHWVVPPTQGRLFNEPAVRTSLEAWSQPWSQGWPEGSLLVPKP
ncbi:TIGR01621 family pseudouridine synthase [Mangrovitalea sediminis]|uniref:TIGR01621 family pseudouridine synthase n=1 Tax=Mangrovitalea sediminis TaxID=1982043 RepID=UPI001D0D24ED|nr:TIGR01621 family pseudouridine synthase [Mangrovitalea sediminis]